MAGVIKTGAASKSEDRASLWTDVETDLKRVVAMTIFGDTDTGRTRLALSAPGPIAFIHSYEKVDGLVQEARRRTLVREHKFSPVYKGAADKVQAAAERELSNVEQAMSDAYRWARSIIIDTETKLWEIAQLARLGSMTRADRDEKDNRRGQLVYQEINNRWASMLGEYRLRKDDPLQNQLTNLILICKTKDEYNGPKATGRTIRASQKDTGFFSDVVLRTYNTRGTFKAVIEKPWWNNAVRGEEMEDDLMNFADIMAVVTESEPEEWQ